MKSIFTFGEKDFSAEFCADGFLSTRTYLHHNHCGNNVDRNKPAVIVKLNHGIENDKTDVTIEILVFNETKDRQFVKFCGQAVFPSKDDTISFLDAVLPRIVHWFDMHPQFEAFPPYAKEYLRNCILANNGKMLYNSWD